MDMHAPVPRTGQGYHVYAERHVDGTIQVHTPAQYRLWHPDRLYHTIGEQLWGESNTEVRRSVVRFRRRHQTYYLIDTPLQGHALEDDPWQARCHSTYPTLAAATTALHLLPTPE